MFELKGKVALVTGAAKRIGYAISIELAKQGVDIIIHHSKSQNEARKLLDEVTSLGVKAWLIGADFASPKSCYELIEHAYEKSGKIDILINNASIFSEDSIDEIMAEDLSSSLLINAWTPFLLGRNFSGKTEYGKIINLLDTRIEGYDFNHFAYYVSKRMLEILTKSMALKLAPRISVNGIAPGLILPPKDKDYSYMEQKKNTVPLRKYGSPSDVVETILFLLRSDFITGQVVYVDGGKHLVRTIEGL